jgi:hypothetical protein
MLSKNNEALIIANNKGYRVLDGKVFYQNRERKLSTNSTGYLRFSIRIDNKPRDVMVHRLVAYQKYGDIILNDGILVRHRDGNAINNSESNILIGNQSDNMMDISPEIRRRSAITASKCMQKHSHEEIIAFHVVDKSYKKTMEKFDISSKGTLFFILKQSMVING